jgi:hypothetical protein
MFKAPEKYFFLSGNKMNLFFLGSTTSSAIFCFNFQRGADAEKIIAILSIFQITFINLLIVGTFFTRSITFLTSTELITESIM